VFASGQVGLQITGRLSVRPGQALGKPAGFMGAWRRRQAFGIFHVTSQYFVDVWVISEDACKYLKMPADI